MSASPGGRENHGARARLVGREREEGAHAASQASLHAKRWSGRAVALTYHDVQAADGSAEPSGFVGPGSDPYKLPAADFAAHLDTIATARLLPETLPELTARAPRRIGVMLTFDDGGVSAYTTIAPMLEAKGWKGQFFVTTDHIGRGGFLNEEQIRELRSRGHVIGTHSCSHPPRMTSLTDDELRREWTQSVGILSELLGERVDTGSVPHGYYSRRVGQAAAAAGVRWLFTSEPAVWPTHVGDCTVLGRFSVRLRTTCSEVADLIADRSRARSRHVLSWNAKKLAKSVGGEGYLLLRSVILRRRRAASPLGGAAHPVGTAAEGGRPGSLG